MGHFIVDNDFSMRSILSWELVRSSVWRV